MTLFFGIIDCIMRSNAEMSLDMICVCGWILTEAPACKCQLQSPMSEPLAVCDWPMPQNSI